MAPMKMGAVMMGGTTEPKKIKWAFVSILLVHTFCGN